MMAPVPTELYKSLMDMYFRHQLFLDAECVMALALVFKTYEDSMPFDDGAASGPINRDVQVPFESVEYLLPRVAGLFQQKLGLASDKNSVRQIARRGSIRILNHYHFPKIDLPAQAPRRLPPGSRAAESVSQAQNNLKALLEKMHQFQN